MRFVPVCTLHQSRIRTGYDATDVVRRSNFHLRGAIYIAQWISRPWPVPTERPCRCCGYYRPSIDRFLWRRAKQATVWRGSRFTERPFAKLRMTIRDSGVLHGEGGTLRADRRGEHRNAGDRGQAVEKRARGRRQVGDAADAANLVGPAGMLFDLHLQARIGQPVDAARRAVGAPVPGDDPEPLEPREHVELGDHQPVEAVELTGVARCDRVVPAAPTRAAGRDAELATDGAQPFAALVVQLGGKRSAADAGAVRLRDAEHASDRRRSDPEPDAGAAGDGVRAGDERIGPVGDVEHRALRAVGQNP